MRTFITFLCQKQIDMTPNFLSITQKSPNYSAECDKSLYEISKWAFDFYTIGYMLKSHIWILETLHCKLQKQHISWSIEWVILLHHRKRGVRLEGQGESLLYSSMPTKNQKQTDPTAKARRFSFNPGIPHAWAENQFLEPHHDLLVRPSLVRSWKRDSNQVS